MNCVREESFTSFYEHRFEDIGTSSLLGLYFALLPITDANWTPILCPTPKILQLLLLSCLFTASCRFCFPYLLSLSCNLSETPRHMFPFLAPAPPLPSFSVCSYPLLNVGPLILFHSERSIAISWQFVPALFFIPLVSSASRSCFR